MTEDETLIRESRDGSQEAFRTLVERYGRPVFNVAYRMTNDCEDAQDITQTVFLKVHRNLAGFDARHRIFSWIYRAAVNESLNFLERRAARVPILADKQVAPPDPEQLLRSAERSRQVQEALMGLAPEHRSVVVLRHLHGCSYRDIAEIVGIPEKTVKARLFAARQRLREICTERGLLPGHVIPARKNTG